MGWLWFRIALGAAVLIGAFVGAVAILNHTVYSPSGYVRTYLDALERKDAAEAIALAGPAPSSAASQDLLAPDVLPDLVVQSVTERDAQLVDGRRMVHVEFTANGTAGATDFTLEPGDPVLGLFRGWAFATTPYVQVDLTVLHTRQFSANGQPRVTPATDAATTYLALAPGLIDFESATKYTTADPQTVLIASPGRAVDVQLAAEADDALVALVAEQAKEYLDGCAAQTMLFPADCPFGHDIADRIAPGSSPAWTIADYPAVDVQPTGTLGQWQVLRSGGTAHLHVRVQSIYDGKVTPLDADVGFSVGYLATFIGADQLVLTPQG